MPASLDEVKRVLRTCHTRLGSSKAYEDVASHLDADDSPIAACTLEGMAVRGVESIPRSAALVLSKRRLLAYYIMAGQRGSVEHVELNTISSVDDIVKSRYAITFSDSGSWTPRLYPSLQFLRRASGVRLHECLKGALQNLPR